jgi:hypothetical protein
MPYVAMLEKGELHQGHNEVRVLAYTTLIRSFEGQWFDVGIHKYREI